MMSNIKISYEKIYTDDSGKHTQDIFSKHTPVAIAYKKLWAGVVDGFFVCNNSDILLTSTEGSIRVVVVVREDGDSFKFEQYFLSGLDGKVITIPSGTKYAIQNVDECKSSFLIGSFISDLDFSYSNKRIFNWRKKNP